MLIFWGEKLVGANFYAFCNYVWEVNLDILWDKFTYKNRFRHHKVCFGPKIWLWKWQWPIWVKNTIINFSSELVETESEKVIDFFHFPRFTIFALILFYACSVLSSYLNLQKLLWWKKNHLISRLSLFQSERRHSAVYFIWNDQVTVRVQVRGQIVNACHLISDVLLHVNFSYLWCSVAASPCFVPSSPPPPLQAAPFQPWAARASFKAAST